MRLRVERMTCGGCARRVTEAIRSVDPDAAVSAEPRERLVEVRSGLGEAAVLAALAEAGYPGVPVPPEPAR